MNEFQATAVIVVLFALRCIVPLALLMAIAYGMNKLVDRWEREDKAPTEARPAIPLPMATRTPVETPRSKIPCWVFNNCDEKTRNACPAYANQSVACWVARLRADGRLPAKCAACPLYTGAPAFGLSGD
jgi:hypothetical protein